MVEGCSDKYLVKVDLHRGSALSLFLFVGVMDVVSECIEREEIGEMPCADDLCLHAESKEQLQNRGIGKSIGATTKESKVSVTHGVLKKVDIVDRPGVHLKQVSCLSSLGSVVCGKGGREEDVRARVPYLASWHLLGISGGKCYATVLRSVMLYGSGLWVLWKTEQ